MNIAITGEGIVSAIGLDKEEVVQSLLDKKTGIGEMKHLQSAHQELPVGEVDLSNGQMKEMLGIPSNVMMSRTSLLGMLAIRQALQDAGMDKETLQAMTGERKPRIVLVSGTTVGGMDMTELCFDKVEDKRSLEFLRHHDCRCRRNGSIVAFPSQRFQLADDPRPRTLPSL